MRLPDGRRYLTLRGFSTAPGPDLRVRLVPGGGDDGAAHGNLDLGALKGNRGDQQYRIPARGPRRPQRRDLVRASRRPANAQQRLASHPGRRVGAFPVTLATVAGRCRL